MSNENLLDRLNDDVVVLILSVITVPDIISCRETCRRLNVFSRLRLVWQRAYVNHVLGPNLPHIYLESHLASLSQQHLEYLTLRALRWEKIWAPVPASPAHHFTFQTPQSNAISDVSFIPGHGDRCLAVVTQGIWAAVSIWDIGEEALGPARRISEWTPPNGATMHAFVVNLEPDAEATIAVSVRPTEGRPAYIELLSLHTSTDARESSATLTSVYTIDTIWIPAMLRGDWIAFGDNDTKTILMDWRTGSNATLESSTDPTKPSQSNKLHQVIVEHNNNIVIVVRAHAIDFFTLPALRPPTGAEEHSPHKPIGVLSVGWVDAISVTRQTYRTDSDQAGAHPAGALSPIGVAMHQTSDNPWSASPRFVNHFLFYSLPRRSHAIPRINTVPHIIFSTNLLRGHVLCPSVRLGAYGTLVYIAPRASEPINPPQWESVRLMRGASMATVWTTEEHAAQWSALEYSEPLARVALGSAGGKVTVLVL